MSEMHSTDYLLSWRIMTELLLKIGITLKEVPAKVETFLSVSTLEGEVMGELKIRMALDKRKGLHPIVFIEAGRDSDIPTMMFDITRTGKVAFKGYGNVAALKGGNQDRVLAFLKLLYACACNGKGEFSWCDNLSQQLYAEIVKLSPQWREIEDQVHRLIKTGDAKLNNASLTSVEAELNELIESLMAVYGDSTSHVVNGAPKLGEYNAFSEEGRFHSELDASPMHYTMRVYMGNRTSIMRLGYATIKFDIVSNFPNRPTLSIVQLALQGARLPIIQAGDTLSDGCPTLYVDDNKFSIRLLEALYRWVCRDDQTLFGPSTSEYIKSIWAKVTATVNPTVLNDCLGPLPYSGKTTSAGQPQEQATMQPVITPHQRSGDWRVLMLESWGLKLSAITEFVGGSVNANILDSYGYNGGLSLSPRKHDASEDDGGIWVTDGEWAGMAKLLIPRKGVIIVDEFTVQKAKQEFGKRAGEEGLRVRGPKVEALYSDKYHEGLTPEERVAHRAATARFLQFLLSGYRNSAEGQVWAEDTVETLHAYWKLFSE